MSGDKCERILLDLLIEEDVAVKSPVGAVGFSNYVLDKARPERGAVVLSVDSAVAFSWLREAKKEAGAAGCVQYDTLEPVLDKMKFMTLQELSKTFGGTKWEDAAFTQELMGYNPLKEMMFVRMYLGGTGAAFFWDAFGLTASETELEQLVRAAVKVDPKDAPPTATADVLKTLQLCGSCGGKNPSSFCSRCKVVKYCGRDCQVAHWKAHKGICKKIGSLSV